jgi:Fur family ferric uptake transcriptional regulator
MREGSPIHDEKAIFAAYLRTHKLKRSEQREVVVDVFLRSDRHLSVDDLLRLVKRRRSDVGRTTVYRTLKLLTAAGLAQELEFAGQTRFEREHNRAHHDHFICTSCHEIFEFSNEAIERIQEEIAAGLGFRIEAHRHHIYGSCAKCQAAQAEAARSAP